MNNPAPVIKTRHIWSKDVNLPLYTINLYFKCNDFCKKCLIKDPKERWNVKQLLKHKFIQKNKNVQIKDFKSFISSFLPKKSSSIVK